MILYFNPICFGHFPQGSTVTFKPDSGSPLGAVRHLWMDLRPCSQCCHRQNPRRFGKLCPCFITLMADASGMSECAGNCGRIATAALDNLPYSTQPPLSAGRIFFSPVGKESYWQVWEPCRFSLWERLNMHSAVLWFSQGSVEGVAASITWSLH